VDVFSGATFARYWSAPEVSANLLAFLNIAGALALGLVVGYERAYHGRAAGMRTYGLVCMASAALTVLAGYPAFWYGGHALASPTVDPTRVIQGIVTGIGFLGAGVIMREGFSISGLTTAASIWSASAIGVLVGIGFYAAAILLTLLSAACMMWGGKLEKLLPSHPALAIAITFRQGFIPEETVLRRTAKQRGYDLAAGSLTIAFAEGRQQWHFIAVRIDPADGTAMAEIARELAAFDGVESFSIAPARN
jgi:putative Mg2+ transporter-C (MgtC) family protein